MKNVRFYLEYPNKTEKNKVTVKNPGNHSGNCIAVLLDLEANLNYCATFEAVFFCKNSDTSFGEVHLDYLREKCKRIPEKLAKEIHPKCWNRAYAYSNEQ